jgi:hypothetical protein
LLLLEVHFRFENAEDVARRVIQRRLEGAVTGRIRVGARPTGDRFVTLDVGQQGRIEGRIIEINRALEPRGDRRRWPMVDVPLIITFCRRLC